MNTSVYSVVSTTRFVWLRRLPYLLFSCLFVFEALNYFGILSFHVDFTWFGRLVSSLVVFGVLVVLNAISERFLRLPLHGGILLCGTILLLVDFWGDILSLYRRWAWYDQVAHFLSGPLITIAFLLFYERLTEMLRWKHPKLVTYLLTVQTTVALAVLYEMEEYIEDLLFLTNRLGDSQDTANDLTLNMVGSLLTIGGIAVYRVLVHKKPR